MDISGLHIIEPKILEDERGYFFESFNEKTLEKCGINQKFVQDNQSFSKKNVLRGLHFQRPPYAQAKLVRVISGSVLDVAVDLRKNSPTYGKYFSVVLSEDNKFSFYIPENFAHGFIALEDNTIFHYKCSNFYNKESEGCILWNDVDINVNWGIDISPILSEKDKEGILFKDFISPF